MSLSKDLFYSCMDGSIKEIYTYLITENLEDKELIKLRQAYDSRFFNGSSDFFHEDKWIEEVIRCYQNYFIVVLTNKENNGEADLIRSLCKLLNKAEAAMDMDTIEEELAVRFEQKGYSFLGGKTLPYYGPYIWKKTEEKLYQVEIPSGIKAVRVKLLNNFISNGWLDFATFGHIRTGGWAEKDCLCCVEERYTEGRESESFLISFLKHETQHLDDYQCYPFLEGEALEYRAKLVELMYYKEPTFFHTLIGQAREVNTPHTSASNRILKELSEHFFGKKELVREIKEWQTIDYIHIQRQAVNLFEQNTDYCNQMKTKKL